MQRKFVSKIKKNDYCRNVVNGKVIILKKMMRKWGLRFVGHDSRGWHCRLESGSHKHEQELSEISSTDTLMPASQTDYSACNWALCDHGHFLI
jgi:hypothetical protein